jgi:hypothetical protein
MRDHSYCVYILANSFHRLYTGVTNDLIVRVKQHKAGADASSFTTRYGIDRLVYFDRRRVPHISILRCGHSPSGPRLLHSAPHSLIQSHHARPTQ